jgi:hypothetical protein
LKALICQHVGTAQLPDATALSLRAGSSIAEHLARTCAGTQNTSICAAANLAELDPAIAPNGGSRAR